MRYLQAGAAGSEKRGENPSDHLGSKGTVRIFESVKDLLPFGFDSF
jgi:hypothetical protein